jgi:Spy/CpxP family protein refolding chaperone
MAITYVGNALPIVCCNGIHGWEAIMRSSSITQLIIGTAVAMSVVAVSAIGSAVAQSPVGQAEVIGQEALTNRYGSPFSETDFRLSDRQQLKGYFLDGSRERFR